MRKQIGKILLDNKDGWQKSRAKIVAVLEKAGYILLEKNDYNAIPNDILFGEKD